MIAVIFEVEPQQGGDYLDLAAALRPLLDQIDGFISVERFESLATPGKFVSLSFWRDEAAVAQWRNTPEHRLVQAAGRAGVLRDYRLRVANVVRDYGMTERDEAPTDSRAHHIAQRGFIDGQAFREHTRPGPVAPNGDQPICKDGRQTDDDPREARGAP